MTSSLSAAADKGLPPDPLETAQTLIALGEPQQAVALLTGLLEDGRAALLARLLLARAMAVAGDTDGALEMARETAYLHPGVAAAALNLGESLLAAGKLPLAIAEFQRALRLDPQLVQAKFLLGCAWLEAGEAERALAEFAALDDYEPADVLAEKVVEARRMQAAARSDPRYVRHLFDQFSVDYEARMLGPLAYRAPAVLRELAALVVPVQANLEILDLGCGTGLAAAAFADWATATDGVDLSPAMIEKARARGLYRELTVADLESYLEVTSRRYDLIVAADTLVYLGDLARVFAGVRQCLRAGGQFLFTVEKADAQDFERGPKRRWRHSENYLRAAATAAGFEIAGLIAASPRNEANIAVDGLAVALALVASPART